MESRMTIVLSEEERAALRTLSEEQLRAMRDQARYLLRQELTRRGMLKDETETETEAEVSNERP